jgi:hypothetical protein
VPLYTLSAFTLTPYADALRRARKQDRIVRVILILVLLLAVPLVCWALGLPAIVIGLRFFSRIVTGSGFSSTVIC